MFRNARMQKMDSCVLIEMYAFLHFPFVYFIPNFLFSKPFLNSFSVYVRWHSDTDRGVKLLFHAWQLSRCTSIWHYRRCRSPRDAIGPVTQWRLRHVLRSHDDQHFTPALMYRRHFSCYALSSNRDNFGHVQ